MISSLAESEALLVSAIVPCTVPYLPMYALSVGSIPYKLGSLCLYNMYLVVQAKRTVARGRSVWLPLRERGDGSSLYMLYVHGLALVLER